MQEIKEQFPIFTTYPNLVFLDNAATTQKPNIVIEAESNFYRCSNANVHRGLYVLSNQATDLYDQARKAVAKFINAEPEEIIFTGGATDSINSLAFSLQLSGMLRKDSKVVLSRLEHHSNILPWQRFTKNIEYLPLTKEWEIDLEKMPPSYDIISLSMASNVTGAYLDLEKFEEKKGEAITILDACQLVAHRPIDVKKLDVDFLVFSSHKMYGPMGLGILYGKRKLLEKLEPFRVGGGMVAEVTKEKATWKELPEKFEAGTPPVAQAIGLAAAIEFINQLGWEKIKEHEDKLKLILDQKLREIKGLELFHPSNVSNHGEVFAFNVQGVHPHDLAQMLGDNDVAVRAGHHCAQLFLEDIQTCGKDVLATTRASLAIYNSEEDISKFASELQKGIKFFHG